MQDAQARAAALDRCSAVKLHGTVPTTMASGVIHQNMHKLIDFVIFVGYLRELAVSNLGMA